MTMIDSEDSPDIARRSKRPRPDPTPTQRALGLLVRREHSRKELTRKLVARGITSDDARDAIDRLSQAGWQDDARFAENLARWRAQAGFGPLHIRAELGSHGLKSDAIAAALAGCETDWDAAARRIVERRFAGAGLAGQKQRRKAIDFLLRRGFDRASAFGALGVGQDAHDDVGSDGE